MTFRDDIHFHFTMLLKMKFYERFCVKQSADKASFCGAQYGVFYRTGELVLLSSPWERSDYIINVPLINSTRFKIPNSMFYSLPKHKLQLYSQYVLSKLSWHLTVAPLSKVWIVENIDSIVSQYIFASGLIYQYQAL